MGDVHGALTASGMALGLCGWDPYFCLMSCLFWSELRLNPPYDCRRERSLGT